MTSPQQNEKDASLTAEERGWLEGWRDRCDVDPALMRHEGYVEMFEQILTYRLAAARPPRLERPADAPEPISPGGES